MGLVTYVLLSTLIAGLQGKFRPELLGYTATTSSIAVITEIMILKLGCYLLSISSQSQLFDLIAYSGYKFVGIIVTIAVAELFSGGNGTGGWVGWTIFFYTFLANSLFLVRDPLDSVVVGELANISIIRCDRLSTFFFPTPEATLVAPCRPTRATRGTKGHSSFSSTRTSCSSSSCGFLRGLELLAYRETKRRERESHV